MVKKPISVSTPISAVESTSVSTSVSTIRKQLAQFALAIESLSLHGALKPVPGELSSQMIRCGKTPCRCQRGSLHGPYIYRIWREGSRVRKVYVKKEDVATVRQQIELHKALQGEIKLLTQIRCRLTK